MNPENKKATLNRLRRIEGQVRGLAAMIEGDRYCIDVVTQVRAVRAALRKVEDQILQDHVAHCVEGAILSGNRLDQRQKADELLKLLTTLED
ncbi:MAG: transcriptional regulator [Proteobacteria bacterium]|jgi:DNA-binding FrmR family transcriptional regulator|nr:MAG: transcriptional regulator [Pseudomonadota bacterium]